MMPCSPRGETQAPGAALPRRIRKIAIVPAFNEESNIAHVLGQLREFAPDFDAVVVDDHSTDRTALLAREMGAKVLSLPVNLGIGGAVQAGYRYAQAKNYDLAVQVDGDRQHSPAFIRQLMGPIEKDQADFVVGSRFLMAGGYRSTRLRRLGIRYLALLSRMFAGIPVTDPTSGFRLANRKAIALLASWYPQDYPEPESLVYLAKHGIRIQEIPVRMSARFAGKSSISIFDTCYYFAKVSTAIVLTAFFFPRRLEKDYD